MSGLPWCERSGGVLLHVTSLPSRAVDGAARRFMERIAAAGLRVWQILPTSPSAGERNPFESASAFAGDPALVDDATAVDRDAFARFCDDNADWLEDWALFAALKSAHGGAPWWRWPAPLRRRDAMALCQAGAALADEMERARLLQCRFETAWSALHRAAEATGLRLFGDVPLFLSRDSADVWAHRELFEVDSEGRFEATVGVPPDAFTDCGQLWGLPPYRWEAMAASGFAWWRRRFEVQARRHDLLRLDHFRGFAAWWRIPPGAQTAVEGAWTAGPGRAAIDALAPVLGKARLVAEDLGVISDDVVALRRSLGLPGMRVLQFAFDGNPDNPHLPEHHGPDTVCYTGTHDNDTTLGWWSTLATERKEQVARVLGDRRMNMPYALVELAWSSPAPLAIVPMQDLLGLDTTARMNRPGIREGNWHWSFQWDQLPADFDAGLRASLDRHGRIP
jgi:4-alpha-glucanotransferase